jgi:hypothetical protein
MKIRTRNAVFISASLTCLLFSTQFVAQTPQATGGDIKLIATFNSRPLPRKRFFLIRGTREENKILIEKIKQTPPMSRECYYRSRGASPALIKWLTENKCDSVYCREIEEKYLSGSQAVPEFEAAYNQGWREFKTPGLARRWLTVNLSADIRNGFYLQKQKAITDLIKQAEVATKAKVISVMTDQQGMAYFTDIEPGNYTISNLVGSETGETSTLWVCEKEVNPGNLPSVLKLSNKKDPKVCEGIEQRLPVCEQTVK